MEHGARLAAARCCGRVKLVSARTPRTWARIKVVFQEAVELRPESRHTFLADACAGDPALRSEVDALIASHDDERPFLDATPSLAPERFSRRRSLRKRIPHRAWRAGRVSVSTRSSNGSVPAE